MKMALYFFLIIVAIVGATYLAGLFMPKEHIEKPDNSLVWIEHPKKGSPITFRVGRFSEVGNSVKLEFTEVGTIHNPIFRVLAYFFFDLEKTIKEYQENLKNHLEKNA